MYTLFWLIFGVGLAILAMAAGVSLGARRRESFGARTPVVDDDLIRKIIEDGEIYVEEDEPLDLDEVDDEEERFWSESWDEPSGDW
ncbi:MAG: hypothetical protein HKN72_02150 [Gemmatimonadetes bacterium]|nr:hypothetical protein [Gemmatimonadota bacterium]NNF11995.1 hypothetical protein [Gemmatimonadota bacterium]NNL30357.1 hypothetical protein [Gemmatimonadota bacterium]